MRREIPNCSFTNIKTSSNFPVTLLIFNHRELLISILSKLYLHRPVFHPISFRWWGFLWLTHSYIYVCVASRERQNVFEMMGIRGARLWAERRTGGIHRAGECVSCICSSGCTRYLRQTDVRENRDCVSLKITFLSWNKPLSPDWCNDLCLSSAGPDLDVITALTRPGSGLMLIVIGVCAIKHLCS